MNYKYNIALSYESQQEKLVEKVYHYLKAEKLSVFFAPSPECQIYLSGRNQREAFYDIFGKKAEYVALFVSSTYLAAVVPMEEAHIAYATHIPDKIIPIYLEDAELPQELLNPKEINYFKANDPAVIANHIAKRVWEDMETDTNTLESDKSKTQFIIEGNIAEKQVFVQSLGSINL